MALKVLESVCRLWFDVEISCGVWRRYIQQTSWNQQRVFSKQWLFASRSYGSWHYVLLTVVRGNMLPLYSGWKSILPNGPDRGPHLPSQTSEYLNFFSVCLCNMSISASHTYRPWRWRQNISRKRWYSPPRLPSVTAVVVITRTQDHSTWTLYKLHPFYVNDVGFIGLKLK